MRRKRVLFAGFVALIFIMAVFCRSVFAVPAAPIVHELVQPDGTVVRAVKWGDERRHGWETRDGYAIAFDRGSKTWHYTDLDKTGRQVLRKERPGIDLPPPGLRKHAEKTESPRPGSAFFSTQAVAKPPQKAIPLSGTAKIPVILVTFSDRDNSTRTTTSDFSGLLFDSGSHSMSDYFEEVSYGAFSLQGEVAGWHTASKSHGYYGQNDGFGQDSFPGTLVREAVAAADAAGFNFAPYDQDGDGYVDVVAIVHQGTGEEASGVDNDIWSHSWTLNEADGAGEYLTNDSLKVNSYIIMPEMLVDNSTIATIGVFAHEYGHALGLPDLYDTDGSSAGAGSWSLMAYGAWCTVLNSGDRPSHLDAWSKYFLGWVNPTAVSGTMADANIEEASQSPDVYQMLGGSPTEGGWGEYFLIENRQKTGFDAGLPGEGLLIWHIDESWPSNDVPCYPPGSQGCVGQHYKVALMQADGQWNLEKENSNTGDPGDPFPGSSGKHSFSGATDPTSDLWSGEPSFVTVSNISSPGPVMTADLNLSDTSTTTTIKKRCPLARPLSDSPRELALLRLFRDRVMERTPLGRQYVQLYYDYGREISDILEGDPALQRKAVMAVLQLAPVVRNTLKGEGEAVLLPHLVRRLEHVAAGIRAKAGPGLQEAINRVLADMRRDSVLQQFGLKMAGRVK